MHYKIKQFLYCIFWWWDKCSSPQIIANFELDKFELDNTSRSFIDKYVKILNKNKKLEAIIVGHTDMLGTDESCSLLSIKRANEVRAYFISKGINPKRIKAMGMGKTLPVWFPEVNEKQKADNRRVEIILLK